MTKLWHFNIMPMGKIVIGLTYFDQFSLLVCYSIHEPGHEKMCLMSYANNKGADQPAHQHSLISAFVVRCLDSIISIAEI